MIKILNMPSLTPLVAVPACRKFIGVHPFHTAGEKYLTALSDVAGVLPVVLPVLGARLSPAQVLCRVDGILLTGSHSNVEPHHYQGPPSADGTMHDPDRDATTLPLIRAAIAAGVPLFAICRGFQELNVALGGTLHQRVHELEGFMDHREDSEAALEVQYGPAHPVHLSANGRLRRWFDRDRLTVNSVHWQGIDRLAPGLTVEATAPDGLVEAVHVTDAAGFTLGVQWHPEWRAGENPDSQVLFNAFGDACRAFAADRAAL